MSAALRQPAEARTGLIRAIAEAGPRHDAAGSFPHDSLARLHDPRLG